MSETLPPLIGVFVGLCGVIGSVLVKSGRFRSWERWYRDPSAPIWQRHIAFAYLPIGLGFLLAVAGGLLLDPNRPSPLGGVAALLAMLSLAWAGLIILRPPEWVKPAWLRREEGGRAVSPTGYELDRFFVVAVVATCLIAALLITGLMLRQ